MAIQAESSSKETVKLLMLGDSGVGKSSLMIRFTSATFSQQMMGTTGIDMRVKQMTFHNKHVNIQIWDTAGQERFHSIARTYYRGAHGIILAYDVTDRTSFTNISFWLEDINKYTKSVHILLVGNKIDLSPVVREEEGKAFAENKGIPFILTSAKNDENVQDAFQHLIGTILESGIATTGEKKKLKDRNKQKKGCC
jgi:small GTP-binding protein